MNESQATACDKFRLLKQEYESAFLEEALYEIVRLRFDRQFNTKVQR
jgi:hypothetical protein